MGSILLGTWTSPVGLVISSCVFGFFHTAFGPTGSECIFLVAGPEQFNFAFGYVLIVMGIGWMLRAPAAGKWQPGKFLCYVWRSKYWLP